VTADLARLLPVLAAAGTGIQVGAAIVATRFVVHETGPASLAMLRYIIGFACLVPPLLVSRRVRIAPRDLIPIAGLGIVQFGVLIALLNYGLSLIPSARAALLFATLPLQTMLIGAVLGRESLSAAKSAGVILSIVGVGVTLGADVAARGTGTAAWIGELAVLLSAFSGASCSVLYRPFLKRYPTLPVSALAMLAAVGFLAILAAGEGFFSSPPAISAGGWAAVVFIGVSSGVGYFLWLWALNHTSPTRVTVFLALSPLTAAILGALLLAEPISLATWAGLGLVILGLVLAHR
jgi:drug/metabolite transporter (DMT)-like permease